MDFTKSVSSELARALKNTIVLRRLVLFDCRFDYLWEQSTVFTQFLLSGLGCKSLEFVRLRLWKQVFSAIQVYCLAKSLKQSRIKDLEVFDGTVAPSVRRWKQLIAVSETLRSLQVLGNILFEGFIADILGTVLGL